MVENNKIAQPDQIGVEAKSVCYLCGKHGILFYRNLVDCLFGAPGKWTFRKCSDPECGLIWLDPRPTLAEIGKAYRTYYTHGQANNAQQTRPARIARTILHTMSIFLLGLRAERRRYKCMYLDQIPSGRLLEVGCGSGKRLVRLQALGWDVTGQEIDPVAAEHVRKVKGIDVHVGPLETMEVAEKYDAVIMSHVIEHVHDPIALLATCRNHMLKENGLLVLLTPNAESYGHHKFGATWRGLEPPRHLHLFTCKTLIQISQKAGFHRQHCWTTPVGADGIGQSSSLSAETIKQGHLLITTCDVLRGFWFQIAASLVFLTDKNSGEECVLMATK
ncbi:bifunctional 2-polyprenyl-6-hydroxyphenol methylase/3-demethylubiquinol 3-O-methyltransferase UbiG [Nitrosomonas sp. Nm166]|uniref:class I SAM-dependent methyltransferase n=1 Tax=Nitrosomonas sp. Nm166 TaxID=1881054 RepID=UPI0008E93612|nr:class I SAM-dependent methyltransferase [Nitrosomonas sp. Nm166]SFE72989.1 Methyltransferase domain-containing protein [Nitrosomonas sp. Nm166]